MKSTVTHEASVVCGFIALWTQLAPTELVRIHCRLVEPQWSKKHSKLSGGGEMKCFVVDDGGSGKRKLICQPCTFCVTHAAGAHTSRKDDVRVRFVAWLYQV